MLKDHARVMAFLIFGLFAGATDAGQEGQDMKLEDVGFIMRPATRKLIARTANGRRYYIYADPDYCKCAFVGNELAMKNYQNLILPPPQAPMTVGSGPPSVTTEMIQEMDSGVDFSFGDIFDFPN